MFTPRGMLGKLGKVGILGMVMPLGKLGGLMPLGRELSRAGMVGNLGRVPGISAAVTRLTEGWMEGRCPEEEEEEEEEVEDAAVGWSERW